MAAGPAGPAGPVPTPMLPNRFEPKSHESDTSSESDSDSVLPADLAARTRVDNTACALLSKPNACVAVVGNWHTQGTFLVMWRVSSATQIFLSLLEHAGPVKGGGGGGVSGVP